MWGAHFQQSSQIQFQTQETFSNWRFHENFVGKWFSKWELCNLTKISTTFSPLLLRNEKSALKKKKKAKKSEKNSSNYFGRGLNCSSAIPRRDEMDTGGEKSDNDIMMESTTSDSGKKVYFLLFYKQRPNFDHSLNSRPVKFLNVFCFLIQANLEFRIPIFPFLHRIIFDLRNYFSLFLQRKAKFWSFLEFLKFFCFSIH